MTRQVPGHLLEFDNVTGVNLGQFASNAPDNVTGLTVAPNGNVLVSSHSGFVREFDGVTGEFVRVVASLGRQAYAMEFGPNGNLFVAMGTLPGTSRGGAVEFDAADGVVPTTYATPLGNPRGLTFGPDGTFFITILVEDVVAEFAPRRFHGTAAKLSQTPERFMTVA